MICALRVFLDYFHSNHCRVLFRLFSFKWLKGAKLYRGLLNSFHFFIQIIADYFNSHWWHSVTEVTNQNSKFGIKI